MVITGTSKAWLAGRKEGRAAKTTPVHPPRSNQHAHASARALQRASAFGRHQAPRRLVGPLRPSAQVLPRAPVFPQIRPVRFGLQSVVQLLRWGLFCAQVR